MQPNTQINNQFDALKSEGDSVNSSDDSEVNEYFQALDTPKHEIIVDNNSSSVM